MSKLSDIIKVSIHNLKILVFVLALSSIISSILVYFLTSTFNLELQFSYSNWIIDISSGLALIFSVILIVRERNRKSSGQNYVSLFIAILLWFSAEIIYTYYQSILRIDVPYPSYADSLWLLGYIFMGYHLYSSFYYWNKKKKVSESSVFIITIFSALLILFMIQSSALTYSNDIFLILVAILYHLADGIILIPALVLLWNLRHEKFLYIHRSLISLFVILNTFANVGYIFTFNTGINSIIEDAWMWDVIYNFSYIILAGALFWYDNLLHILNRMIEQSLISIKKQFYFLLEKHRQDEIIVNKSFSYIDGVNIKDTICTLITNAKTEISLLIFIQNKYNQNLILNLNLLLTDCKIRKNVKMRILSDNIFNVKLLFPNESTNADIQYGKIAKIFKSDMIIFIIDYQHLLFMDLKQDNSENSFLAAYSGNSNIILQFSSFYEKLLTLSELREQII